MSATVIKTTFKLKRSTSARWEELNPILAEGEPGFAIDTFVLKVGDGVKTWKELPGFDSSELAPVATSGLIEDLNQKETITFYGGSASDVMEV